MDLAVVIDGLCDWRCRSGSRRLAGKNMRIGIDGSCWMNRRGFGRFTRAIVRELVERHDDHSYVLVVDAASARVAEIPARVDVLPVAVRRAAIEAASASSHRSVSDVLRMSIAARRAGCKAFYFPSTYTYYPVPGTPTVVTVHDATAEKNPALIFATRRARAFWAAKQRLAVRSAKAVLTVSDSSREDIVRCLRVRREDVEVIREAPDPRFRPIPPSEQSPVLARFGLTPSDRYVVYVGGISPHKNLELLVEAFSDVSLRHPDVRLLIVGDTKDDPFLSSAQLLRQVCGRSMAASRISMTGFVPDTHLVALYAGAVASVLPSLAEGFGLTAAESAACGTPVIATDIPALRELLGEAALYALPGDRHGLSDRLSQLLEDRCLRDQLAAAALDRASSWSWGPAAEMLASTLERVAS